MAPYQNDHFLHVRAGMANVSSLARLEIVTACIV